MLDCGRNRVIIIDISGSIKASEMSKMNFLD